MSQDAWSERYSELQFSRCDVGLIHAMSRPVGGVDKLSRAAMQLRCYWENQDERRRHRGMHGDRGTWQGWGATLSVEPHRLLAPARPRAKKKSQTNGGMLDPVEGLSKEIRSSHGTCSLSTVEVCMPADRRKSIRRSVGSFDM